VEGWKGGGLDGWIGGRGGGVRGYSTAQKGLVGMGCSAVILLNRTLDLLGLSLTVRHVTGMVRIT
jgi:hypothetical protein